MGISADAGVRVLGGFVIGPSSFGIAVVSYNLIGAAVYANSSPLNLTESVIQISLKMRGGRARRIRDLTYVEPHDQGV